MNYKAKWHNYRDDFDLSFRILIVLLYIDNKYICFDNSWHDKSQCVCVCSREKER